MSIVIPPNHTIGVYQGENKTSPDRAGYALQSLVEIPNPTPHAAIVYSAKFLIPFNRVRELAYMGFVLDQSGCPGIVEFSPTLRLTEEGVIVTNNVLAVCADGSDDAPCGFDTNKELFEHIGEEKWEDFLQNHPCSNTLQSVNAALVDPQAIDDCGLEGELSVSDFIGDLADFKTLEDIPPNYEIFARELTDPSGKIWWFVAFVNED